MRKRAIFIYSLFLVQYSLFSQNVGIGTTTPEGVLHLKGTNWIKTIFENNTGDARGYIGADNNGTITIGANAYWNGSNWIYPNTGSSMYLLLHRPNNRFEFRVRPDGGNQATAMTIDTGSNVGIGGSLVVDQENGNTGIVNTNSLRFGNFSGEGIGSKRNAGTGQFGLDFYTNSINRMTVANNGNVGIGTTNPLTVLDVNGSIRIGNSNVNHTGSIRYNNNRFEGYTNGGWKGFEQISGSSVITSYEATDNDLLAQGYKFVGGLPGVITRDTNSYNVTANTWRPVLSKLNFSPPPTYGESVAWTGTHLIVWGGADGNYENTDPDFPPTKTYNEGYYYDFTSNLWDTIKVLPEARFQHSTVWTGQDMIIWGGRRSNSDLSFTSWNNGARLNGASKFWSFISSPGLAARYNHTAVWTGNEMIVWGGQATSERSSVFADGARYNPSTNNWTGISTLNAPSARTQHKAIWVAGKMVIWGGFGSNGLPLNNGAMYDPATNTWTTMSTTNAPGNASSYTIFLNGNSVSFWGGSLGGTGYTFNPTTNSWSLFSFGSNVVPRNNPAILRIPAGTFIFGGYNGTSYYILDHANLGSNTYHPPKGRAAAGSYLFWTGNFLITYGGFRPVTDILKGATNIFNRFFVAPQNITEINETYRTLFIYQKE